MRLWGGDSATALYGAAGLEISEKNSQRRR